MKKKGNEKIKKIIITGLCCLGMLLLVCCGKQGKMETQSENLPQIVVGSDNYPPFNYTDMDGRPTGIDIDLAREAFSRMGYEPVFKTINWEEKKQLLTEGKIDCIWGCFSMDGREDEYQWAGPYMVSRQSVAVDVNSDIYTLDDLEGKTIALQSTTKPEELFRNYSQYGLPKPREIISVQNRELIYSFLSKQYADAVAAHETAILQYMEDYGVTYRILDEPLMEVGLGIAFDLHDERGIAGQLTEVLEEMRQDGTVAEIIGRYLDNPEKYLEVNTYVQ